MRKKNQLEPYHTCFEFYYLCTRYNNVYNNLPLNNKTEEEIADLKLAFVANFKIELKKWLNQAQNLKDDDNDLNEAKDYAELMLEYLKIIDASKLTLLSETMLFLKKYLLIVKEQEKLQEWSLKNEREKNAKKSLKYLVYFLYGAAISGILAYGTIQIYDMQTIISKQEVTKEESLLRKKVK